MKFNGNITLNALGQSEIQNLIVERFAATPALFSSEAGRLIYNTADKLFYMNTGAAWIPLSTGGTTTTLQNEITALEASIGPIVTSTGVFNPAALTGSFAVNASSITDALNKLDAAVSGKDMLVELLDVAAAGAAAGQFLRYDTVSSKWVNHTLVAADVTDLTASAAELNFVKGVTSPIQTQITTEVTRATAAEGANTAAISAEVTRATAAEAALGTSSSANTAAIAAEVTRATAAEGVNHTAILQEATDRVAADIVVAANAATATATEATSRQAMDTTINTRIDGVQTELDLTQAGAGLDVTGTFTAPSATTYLGSATSLKDADVKLDTALHAEVVARISAGTSAAAALTAETQARIDGDANLQTQLTNYVNAAVTNNVNADNAETAARIAADAAIQAELDATQAAAGLSTAGAYVADASTHYIGAATTLANADKLLDAQINVVAASLASQIASNATSDAQTTADLTAEITARINGDITIHTELAGIEAGAGLGAMGAYTAPTGTNYLASSTTLADADKKLDSAIKAEATRAAAAEVANSGLIAAEVTRATAAEGVLTSSVAAEVTRATAAEGVNAAAIAAEVTRATAGEATNATAIAGEVTRATAAESDITAKLSKGYFLYTGAAASTHTVSHGIGSQFCNVTVIDSSTNEQIIPQSVVFDSATQLTVTFNVSLACKVVVMGLGV